MGIRKDLTQWVRIGYPGVLDIDPMDLVSDEPISGKEAVKRALRKAKERWSQDAQQQDWVGKTVGEWLESLPDQ